MIYCGGMENDRTEFYSVLADVLEVASIAPGDDYRMTPLWGSLTCFALKVTIAQRFGRDVPLKELDSFGTAGALAERVLG